MSQPSDRATSKFRHIQDPDMARDLAFDYDADLEAQYDDYVEECRMEGVEPKPFKDEGLLGGNPIKRVGR